jgi:O-acetyl-ADP-ribose deacetylase (regulator of RNase III)
MITVIKGDLIQNALDSKYDAIAHGCNCHCTMGAGIAAGIRKFFPEATEMDNKTKSGDFKKLGNYTVVDLSTCSVFNLYTQFNFNPKDKPFVYEAFALALMKMACRLKSLNKTKIGLPLIGFGLAGGDLNKILQIIHDKLKDFEVEIVVYEYENDADGILQKIENFIKNSI